LVSADFFEGEGSWFVSSCFAVGDWVAGCCSQVISTLKIQHKDQCAEIGDRGLHIRCTALLLLGDFGDFGDGFAPRLGLPLFAPTTAALPKLGLLPPRDGPWTETFLGGILCYELVCDELCCGYAVAFSCDY
jgi:hypothetical protein